MAEVYLTSFQRNYESLFDKVDDFERIVVPMKKWCDEFIENVREHFRRPTVMRYEREVGKLKHIIEEIETNIKGKMAQIIKDALRADEIYNFFDPNTFDDWFGLERDLVEYKDVLWIHLNAFFVFMPKFLEVKKSVEEECRRLKKDF